MGFKGFLISDLNAVDYMAGGTTANVNPTSLATAINAGLDMIMTTDNPSSVIGAITGEIGTGAGQIPQSRIDDAVTRILEVKCSMGLFAAGYTGQVPTDNATLTGIIGSKAHRTIARQAVQESVVVLQNTGTILPLKKTATKILVTGKSANSIANQLGGWTVTWQGTGAAGAGSETGVTTIYQAIKNELPSATVTTTTDGSGAAGNDYAIAIIGETPYAEWYGDNNNLALDASDTTTLTNLANSGVPTVVVILSGRPLIVSSGQLAGAAGWVAAWLPGSEGEGVVDVLFGDAHPKGTLPFSWPSAMSQVPIHVGDANYAPLFAYGFGLTY
jgi:beta-glucosidase